MPYYIFFNNTIIVQVRYIIIETKEFARIGYITGFFFRIRTSAFNWLLVWKKKPVIYPIRAASFVSIVLYPIYVTHFLNLRMTRALYIIYFLTLLFLSFNFIF